MHTHTETCTCAHTHTPVAYQGNQGNGTEEKVFKEDLKELTEIEWWTETGSWFQITSRECGHFTMTKEKKKPVY